MSSLSAQVTQAILFKKPKYTLAGAKKWLSSHGYVPIKYHITNNYIHARLAEPNYNKYHYRTNRLGKDIKAIVGYGATMTPRRPFRPARIRPQVYSAAGGSLDPRTVNMGIDMLANLVLPALLYGGVSYGVYRAAKK